MSRPRKYPIGYQSYIPKTNQHMHKTLREVAEILKISPQQTASTETVALYKLLKGLMSDSQIIHHYDGDTLRFLSSFQSTTSIDIDVVARIFKLVIHRHVELKKLWKIEL